MYNFDQTIQGALDLAQSEALARRHNELTEWHLLWGLMKHPQAVSSKALKSEKKTLTQQLDLLPVLGHVSLDQIRPSAKLSEWLTLASSESIQAGRDKIKEVDLLRHIQKFFPRLQFEMPEEAESEVPEFITDLNQLAAQGKLDPVIGRAMEIRRVQEILCRRTKNNPVLVGSPGVGKTAIIEGLAGLIESGQVPDFIQGKTIYSLNMGSLMAGTKYRGDFEERMEGLVKFLKSKGREAIIFIDEIHLLIGAGKTEGAMDAANLLKPALARGELNCIGATTLEEYKKYIETDSALERRFHQVMVDEPSKEDSIQILMGLKEKLEIHHGVEITEEAIVAAVYLSEQFISDRFLPDKAIDIIDEAAAALKFSADSMPPELEELGSLIRSKKILLTAHKGNNSLAKEIEDLEQDYQTQKQSWEKKTLELKRAAQVKQQLDSLHFQLQKAEQEGDFEKASKLKYGDIPALLDELKKVEITWKVTKQNVGEVVARSTGVPVERVLRSQQEYLLELEDFLNQRVYGQAPALASIADTLIAAHAGLSDQTRPLGSFMLLGPSGVGKTETAKALAEFLFQDERHLIRLDLSEYSERHSVAKLIGAPPGYVGYDKGGILTEAVRRNPYSVILMDEVEKAHLDFSDILLQILDEGHLTDTQGRRVNFKNCLLILTTNLPDPVAYFKPELLGRLDEILSFQQLDQSIVAKLVEREVKILNEKLEEKEIQLTLDPALANKIQDLGFDVTYGARPLKNVFNRLVIKPLAKILLQESGIKGSYLLCQNEQEQLLLQKR